MVGEGVAAGDDLHVLAAAAVGAFHDYFRVLAERAGTCVVVG